MPAGFEKGLTNGYRLLMTRINVVGDSLIDLNFSLPRELIRRYHQQAKIELPFGEKLSTEGYDLSPGGSGANVSVGLKKAGLSIWFSTGLATDVFGRFLKERLEKEGIELSVEPSGDQTAISVILRSGGERTIVTSRRAESTWPKSIPTAGWIHLGPFHGSADQFFQDLLAQQVKTDQEISFNPSVEMLQSRDRDLLTLLKTTAIIFLNVHEALVLTRLPERTDKADLIRSVARLGPKIVCLTDGERGAYVQSEDGLYFAPALTDRSVRVDATGAGDAFASGFLAAYLQSSPELDGGEQLRQSLAAAIANSTSAVSTIGAQTGLLSLKEMQNDAGRVKIKRLND